ncbi:bifunctional 4-hydroxy-2-oxoglutarate aldolase/2-dehydro-3-deoxy-phosphogluconate aldolase [Bacillus smithii]|uniref:bifunctional 4-hydroxy-2-oxoglutarate aldolase/2-dehydro-3-deoxy-phosphogluconate aldolase n=1 Tax=Bacillus smithii TaxID=1479 RepID=UPI002E209B0F|nr:bifunctional 4-hydroxy-2-oxoglutarate aldolase/2-dehydro-3-deoxy-phosphogluconate aldolase [Bacillus smithii]MED1455292.1 bifunctional 4-hydroxy-2-oxoglutarate aldolase/2-dehydro-3-deoxy-phosphogluconate aldolase [Bacillus smithii]
MEPLSTILENKIIAIIRGSKPKDVLSIAKALKDGGIKVLEITMNSPKALTVIEEVSSELGDEIVVGAGTVLDPESARAALLSGAKFILSPTTDIETIRLTKRYGAVSIPAALTPTEILNAYENGGDIIKVFPASALGPAYIKDLHGPLPQIPLLPTGGIDLNNISHYINAGAAGVGLGSSLVNANQVMTEDSLHKLTEKAKQFVEAVKHAQD